MQLVLEDAEQSAAESDAAKDAAEPSERRRRIAVANRNRGTLPAHLPRCAVVIDVENKDCPCCGGVLHMIGEDRSEMLDLVPAQLRVKVVCRPRYGCRTCEGAVVQAPAPERPIDGGMTTEALIAHVVVSKFCELAATLSPGADAQAPRHHLGPFHAECLGGTRVLVAGAAV